MHFLCRMIIAVSGIQIPNIDNKNSSFWSRKALLPLLSLYYNAHFHFGKIANSHLSSFLLQLRAHSHPKNLLSFLEHCADFTISSSYPDVKETVKIIIAL